LPLSPPAGSPGYVEVEGTEALAQAYSMMSGVGGLPQLALLLGYEPGAAPSLPFDAASVSGSDALQWLARGGSRPGAAPRTPGEPAQAWVALSTVEHAQAALAGARGADGKLPPQTPEYLAELARALYAPVADALRPLAGASPPAAPPPPPPAAAAF
jgi:hypothetical protein